jgi:hypothetical protein
MADQFDEFCREFIDRLVPPPAATSIRDSFLRRIFDALGPDAMAVVRGEPARRHRLSRGQRIKRGEKALNELYLSVLTNADKERISHIWSAMKDLDDEQAEAKAARDTQPKPNLEPFRKLTEEWHDRVVGINSHGEEQGDGYRADECHKCQRELLAAIREAEGDRG